MAGAIIGNYIGYYLGRGEFPLPGGMPIARAHPLSPDISRGLHQTYCAPDRNGRTRSQSMRWALCIIFLFAFLAWGLAENNGHYAHMISSGIGDLGRRLGLW
jgi:hypothetical protein